MLPEQKQRILGYFLEETKDHLNTIEQGLMNLQNTLADPEIVNEIFRAAHSIKGGAAMLGLDSIQQTAHRLEDYFKVFQECPGIQVDQKLESLFLRVFDTLQELLEHLADSFSLPEDVVNNLMSEVEPVFEALNQHLGVLAKVKVTPSSPEAQDDLNDLFALELDENEPLLNDTTEPNEKLAIDSLFDEAELPPILARPEAEFGDLFNTTEETEESHYPVEAWMQANSTEDADTRDFWQEGAKEQFEPEEEDANKALEENRCASLYHFKKFSLQIKP